LLGAAIAVGDRAHGRSLRGATGFDALADGFGVLRLLDGWLQDLGQSIRLGPRTAKRLDLRCCLAELRNFAFLRLDFQATGGGERLGDTSALPLALELRPDWVQRVRNIESRPVRVFSLMELAAELDELDAERISGLIRLGSAHLGGLMQRDGLSALTVLAHDGLRELVKHSLCHPQLLLGHRAGF
jgi:hypothetical protein